MSKDYVTEVNGSYRVTGTRVSLDSVVYAFVNGVSPESIVDSFPALTVEQVYGAIAYYLAHQAEVGAYLRQGESEFAALSQRLRERNLLLYQKLMAFRHQKQAIAHESEPTES
jgi:uncharacterized protein (DUF433 family)